MDREKLTLFIAGFIYFVFNLLIFIFPLVLIKGNPFSGTISLVYYSIKYFEKTQLNLEMLNEVNIISIILLALILPTFIVSLALLLDKGKRLSFLSWLTYGIYVSQFVVISMMLTLKRRVELILPYISGTFSSSSSAGNLYYGCSAIYYTLNGYIFFKNIYIYIDIGIIVAVLFASVKIILKNEKK
ncbi:hypothetical protein IOK49_06495 [Fervidicoccus fontis]|uniref:Uncharacterized protein n=1 Tax=Fervidicoccus fontis TaxID=683846 RepID=A0A7C2VCF8_9CREN|nr:hypothetical protein [Fervidicoccus fontis]MBE9391713.1 hypothetical protein [Fervidicoccus fontis]PMB76636.1 MAG: hypothetical protein C0177_05545 [Fervidicoccus fontis]HEW63888.1 hypothetical protein [Fervidicoccus fontis]